MKTTKNSLIISLILATGLTLNSCKKKDTTETIPPQANGTIAFHLHTNVDSAEVDEYGTVYTTSYGRKISVTMAQLYLSNIQLIKLNGSTVDVAGVIKLQKQQNEIYTLGSVPSGNYKSVKFNVGLGTSTNASVPAVSDSTLNQPAMWFGATAQPSGFVFVNFEGTIDTTTAHNGSILQMQPFAYKIGTNVNLKSVTMPANNYTVSPNQVQFIHMIIDYSMLFDYIPLNNSNNLIMNTPAANNTPLGTQIANNIQMMFMYEM